MRLKLLLPIGAILLISVSSLTAQRLKIDTVYYNRSGELVDKTTDHLTYEVQSLDRKKRIVGVVKKHAKTGRLLETITYKKGKKEGLYQRFHRNGNLMMYGDYKEGKRSDFWAIYDQQKAIIKLQEYDSEGELKLTRDTPLPFKNSKDLNSEIDISRETSPEFPGGMDNWNSHLRRHLSIPTQAKKYGRGEALLTFVVLSDGRIVLPKAIHSTHPSLTKEGIRVLYLSPRWKPALLDGKPVDSVMNLRIVFKSN